MNSDGKKSDVEKIFVKKTWQWKFFLKNMLKRSLMVKILNKKKHAAKSRRAEKKYHTRKSDC